MVIRVEKVPASRFSKLVDFIDQQELPVPKIYIQQLDLRVYDYKTPKEIKPISLRSIKYDEDDESYSFTIVISQLVRVAEIDRHLSVDTSALKNSSVEDILKAYSYHLVDLRMTIPRRMIDGIMNILDIFSDDDHQQSICLNI